PNALRLRVLGTVAHMQCEVRAAVDHFSEGVEASSTSTGAESLGYLGGFQAFADQFDAARATLEAARNEVMRSGRSQFIVDYHWFRAGLDFIEGRWDDALVEAEAS